MSIQICEEFGLSSSKLSEIGTFIGKGIDDTASLLAPLLDMGAVNATTLVNKCNEEITAVNTVEEFFIKHGRFLTHAQTDKISDEADPHAYVRSLASKLSAAEIFYKETFDAVFNSGVNAFDEVGSKEA